MTKHKKFDPQEAQTHAQSLIPEEGWKVVPVARLDEVGLVVNARDIDTRELDEDGNASMREVYDREDDTGVLYLPATIHTLRDYLAYLNVLGSIFGYQSDNTYLKAYYAWQWAISASAFPLGKLGMEFVEDEVRRLVSSSRHHDGLAKALFADGLVALLSEAA